MIQSQDRTREPAWLFAGAGALLLAGPLARYLYHERYPLASVEAVILVGGLALVGAILAWAGGRLGPRVGVPVLAIFLVLHLDLQYNLERHISFKLVALGCLLIALVFHRRLAALVSIVLVAFYGTSAFSRSNSERAFQTTTATASAEVLRPIVHVILDEHLGLGGFRAIGDSATADFLTDFYTSRGFDLYDAAYSRFYFTRSSIPGTLSLGQLPESTMAREGPRGRFRVVENPYFAQLARVGYRIHVYQTDFMDYCFHAPTPIASCVQVPAASIVNLRSIDAPWWRRARRIVEFYLNTSSYLAVRVWPPLGRRGYGRSVAPRALTVIRRAADDIAHAPQSGDFFFLHVLAPHPPFELGERCELRQSLGGWNPTARVSKQPNQRSRDLEAYRLQIRCLHRELGRLLDSVDRRFGPGRAVVVVHGDHGLRLSGIRATTPNLDRLPISELATGFSALLAVRLGAHSPERHPEPVPVQDYIWALASGGFTPVGPRVWTPFVYFSTFSPTPQQTRRPLDPAEMRWVDPAWIKAAEKP